MKTHWAPLWLGLLLTGAAEASPFRCENPTANDLMAGIKDSAESRGGKLVVEGSQPYPLSGVWGREFPLEGGERYELLVSAGVNTWAKAGVQDARGRAINSTEVISSPRLKLAFQVPIDAPYVVNIGALGDEPRRCFYWSLYLFQ